ncbi:unnamed protein product [Acanthoscelides obtectus]|uniref:Reverse transcriptase domain-containing protein n=1 Tax=Acanthoscelides obtectus TaxID=200917 RepID=A0A9P0PER8_ACAOB|nr:unnamed protein product [Acanthoscelides obtectus]CAK1633692.1 hypothetical protein AOBTE_LOCUS8325 [Acanthoscelides obtectus]
MLLSYLENRKMRIEPVRDHLIEMNAGVPQGLILGLTLWNNLYNGLLELEMPHGITLIAYADNLAVVVVARGEIELKQKADWAIEEVRCWLKGRSMSLAPEKTEAVIITKKMRLQQISFLVDGQEVRPGKALLYLGEWIDGRLTFGEHISRTATKAAKLVALLSRLMPNIGGPRASKRATLGSVAYSVMLYASPIWEGAMRVK